MMSDNLLREIRRAAGGERHVTGRILAAFDRHDRSITSLDKFMSMTREDFMELENVGEKTTIAMLELQVKIRQRDKRYVKSERSVDIRNRNRDQDTTHRTVSPLTLKIEKLIGTSIAGTTDQVINDLGFVDLGMFLLVTPETLAKRGVTVLERSQVSDIQNMVRDVLFKRATKTFYSDDLKPLLLSGANQQSDVRVITTTVDLSVNDLYLVDRQKHAVAWIDPKQFIMLVGQPLDAALLNRIADHYKCWVCQRTLAMVIGKSILDRSK